MVLAKKLGFKIVFIDDPRSIKQTYIKPPDQTQYMEYTRQEQLRKQSLSEQDARDGRMFDTVTASINDHSKGLMVIGSNHVKKSKGESSEDEQVWVRGIGYRLNEQFGDQVSSIRYLHSSEGMDGIIYKSTKPAPEDIYPKLQDSLAKPTGVVVMKDEGLFEGDKKVSDSDFVLIPTMK
jgi:erythromycin esterase-like protein